MIPTDLPQEIPENGRDHGMTWAARLGAAGMDGSGTCYSRALGGLAAIPRRR